MASPTVQGGTNTARTSAETTSPVNYPATTVNKELLILHGRVCVAGAITVPGFTQLAQDSSDASDDVEYVGWKMADGTEGGTTVSVTHGNGKSSWVMSRIQGADLPTVNPPVISSVVVGTNTTPDPPNLTPSYGSRDYLWLWLGGWEGEQTNPPATAPTNYTIINNAGTGTTGNTDTNNRVADYRRATTASSENPPTVTISVAAVGWSAWTVAVPPPIPQTVTCGLISNSPTMFAMTVQPSVSLGLISNGPTMYAPTVKNQVGALSLINNSYTIFAPDVKPSVSLGLISNSPTVYAIDHIDQATPSNDIHIDALIDNSYQIFAPTVKPSVSLGMISNTATIYAPTVTNSVSLGLINNSFTMFSPTASQSSVILGLITNTPTMYAPKVQLQIGYAAEIGIPFLWGVYPDEPETAFYYIFEPTVGLSSTLGRIDNTPTMYAPTVQQNVTLGLISNSYTIYAPSVKPSVTLGLISNTPTVYAPSVQEQVNLGLIANSYNIYAPAVKTSVLLGLISNTATMYEPTIMGNQQVSLGLINNGYTMFAPSVQGSVALGLITNSPTVFAPTLTEQIVLGLINNSFTIYALEPQSSVVLGRITNGYTIYVPEVQLSITLELIENDPVVYAVTVRKSFGDPDIFLVGVRPRTIRKEASPGRDFSWEGQGPRKFTGAVNGPAPSRLKGYPPV